MEKVITTRIKNATIIRVILVEPRMNGIVMKK